MRLRLDQVELVGTTTVPVTFRPGLSVVAGPIQTGKTSLWRLMRFVLGTRKPENNPPEVEAFVKAVGASLQVGDRNAQILRPFVSTDTSLVDVVLPGDAMLLPARRLVPASDLTYAGWMMQELGLPQVEVRRRRTDPESELEPLSLADFLEWCFLEQDALEVGLFNAVDSFHEAKRRYVFEYLYGIADIDLATAEAELSLALRELGGLEQREKVISAFLKEANVDSREAAHQRIQNIDVELKDLGSRGPSDELSGEARSLRERILDLDQQIGELERQARIEAGTAAEMATLAAQLRTQLTRLNRAVVSEAVLIDFEFEECPRCGQQLPERDPHDCRLCGQHLEPRGTKTDLLGERERVIAQLDETLELHEARQKTAASLRQQQVDLRSRRVDLSEQLEAQTARFVSDRQSRLEAESRRLGELSAERQRYVELERLYDSFQSLGSAHASLRQRVAELRARVDDMRAANRSRDAVFVELEGILSDVLDRLGVIPLGPVRDIRIDRMTYEPTFEGRSFESLSSGGLRVVTNIAHAVAHHIFATRHPESRLPRLLVIDSPRKNLGREGYDVSIGDRLYELLIGLAEDSANDTQVILMDNGTPDFAAEFVVRHLDLADRLIPAA